MMESSEDERHDFVDVTVRLRRNTLHMADGILSQQSGAGLASDFVSIGALIDKSIQLYEALWRMQSDGASFFVDNIRAPIGESEVRAQRSVSQARVRTNRRVLLPFKVR